MFESLKRKLSEKLFVGNFDFLCPRCGQGIDLPFERNAARKHPTVCPYCQHSIPADQLIQLKHDPTIVPSHTFPIPGNSRIEKMTASENELVYSIPASDNSGGMLFFGGIWTGFTAAFTLHLVFTGVFKRFTTKDWTFCLSLLAVFWTVGLGILYAGLQMKYAKHLLYLGSDQIRLNRELFGRTKKYSLPITGDIHVSKTVFYTQNYQPVYGIEISTGSKKKLRFGSSLSEADKSWLCAEIQEHLRRRV